MKALLDEINLENGSNYKKAVLAKYIDNELLKELLQKTYCKVSWTYGVSLKTIDKALIGVNNDEEILTFAEALKAIEKLHTREFTGNAAIDFLHTLFNSITPDSRDILIKVLRRDLRINIGRTGINKIFKGLIVKKAYMRCDILRPDSTVDGKLKKGTIRNIDFSDGAFIQLKADGRFTETAKTDDDIIFETRNGEGHPYPLFQSLFNQVDLNGYFHGEMTVVLDDLLLKKITPKLAKADKKNDTTNVKDITAAYTQHKADGREYILPRSIGNGLLNSKDVPEENIIYDLWDYITEEDYALASLKDKKKLPKTKYKDRFEKLKEIVALIGSDKIRLVEYKIVFNIKEAMEQVSLWMNLGLEGGILKDFDMLFKDGTSGFQLKCKLIISGEFRVTGFIEGTPGTKREETFGSLIFENDEGTIKGSTSGFNDEMLELINSNREDWIGKVIEVEFNDITKGRNNDYWALSHPRFIADRSDEKDTTDSLERCQDMKEMAMLFE
jgi:hypothetical protein